MEPQDLQLKMAGELQPGDSVRPVTYSAPWETVVAVEHDLKAKTVTIRFVRSVEGTPFVSRTWNWFGSDYKFEVLV